MPVALYRHDTAYADPDAFVTFDRHVAAFVGRRNRERAATGPGHPH